MCEVRNKYISTRSKMLNHERLKKLYDLVKMIDQAKLGIDWESKKEFEKIKKDALEQIKIIEDQMRNKNVVK